MTKNIYPCDWAKLIILFLTAVVLSLIFSSCSSTKKLDNKAVDRVLASKPLTEKVGREWEKDNPCKNVITKMLPGAVIMQPYPVEKLIKALDSAGMVKYYDSLNKALRLKYNEQQKDCSRQVNDAFNTGYEKAKYELSQQLQPVKQPDTAFEEDTRRLGIAIDSMNYYKGLYTQKTAESGEYKKERNKSRLYLWILVAIIAGIGAYKIFKNFRPTIKL